MAARTRALTVFVAALLLVVVSCKREGSNRDTATTDSGVAPTQAGATDTSYVGGGGNSTTTTGPTSTDTAGTSGGTAMTAGAPSSSAGTSDVGGGSKAGAAAAKKAKTEPGSPGKKH